MHPCYEAKFSEITLIQASHGWLYYFCRVHNLVDRHIDQTTTLRHVCEQTEIEHSIANFKTEKIPYIHQKYGPNMVVNF